MASLTRLASLMLIYILIEYSACTMIREYHFETASRTWSESKAFCKTYYDGLATILTPNDLNSAVFTIPIIVGSEINRIWIGLNDIDTEGVWKWDDNTTCSHNATTGGHDCSDFWYNAEPNDWEPAGGEDCGTLWDLDDNWFMNDENCDNLFPALCNKPFEYKYHWNATFMNWTTAQNYCNIRHGGLATIQTSNDYMNAINAIGPGADRAWIGLTDMNNEGVWEWSNGDKCIVDNKTISHDCSVYWLEGQPDDWSEEGEDCGELWYYRGSGNWLFNDLDCSYTSTVLCIESNTAHPTPQPAEDIHGVHFVFSPIQRKWAEALVYCEQNYFGLASVISDNELNEILQLIPNNEDVMSTHHVWIGLNDLKMEGVWEWSDGTQCKLNNNNCTDLWGRGEPNNAEEEENCAQLFYDYNTQTWHINDIYCDYLYAVLCSKNETTSNPTTRNPTYHPTVSPLTIKPSKSPTLISSTSFTSNQPTMSPISSINNTINGNGNKSSDSSSNSVSTLDIILILIIILLFIGLASTMFCLIKFKRMHKSVEELSNYVGQKDTTKDMQLIDDNDDDDNDQHIEEAN